MVAFSFLSAPSIPLSPLRVVPDALGTSSHASQLDYKISKAQAVSYHPVRPPEHPGGRQL